MKKIINGIIVVEGKTDVAFLSTYFDAEFVITNGSEISQETINYLKKMSSQKSIYVLTDPDAPGKRIRDVLDSQIEGLKHCFITKENSIKHGKVGVAEGNIKEIEKSLENYFVLDKKSSTNILTSSDLLKLGLSGGEGANKKRYDVSKKLNIGYCNAKTFLKRVNSMNLSYNELEKLL